MLMGCMGDLVLLKKHRLSPTASLVLGRHSADLANLGTTADSCSVPKQAQRSFFRIPRILEKDNQGGFEKSTENQKQPQSKKVDSRDNALLSSSRADEIGVAKQGEAAASLVIHKENTRTLESTFDNLTAKAHKVDSSDNANILSKSQVSLEKPTPNTQKTPKAQASTGF